MNNKYDKGAGLGSVEIISDNTLCCAETGRVIAVFYNDYDLDEVIEAGSKEKNESVKIIQIMGMTNDHHWKGHVLGLGDDGVTYISYHVDQNHCWEVYVPLKFK